MRGEKWLTIKYRKLVYTMLLHRNITVVMGDSGAGKTTLVSLIKDYRNKRGAPEIKINGSTDVYILPLEWSYADLDIRTKRNSILIADEGIDYIYRKCFADAIKKSSNYFVLISRRPLQMIPYSCTEVVRFKTTNRNDVFFTESVKYINYYSEVRDVDTVLVEDSNSGYSMYETVYPEVNIKAAGGNSNIMPIVERTLANTEKTLLVIADGSAVGPYAQELMTYLNSNRSRLIVWFPESFEYLLLVSKIVYRKGTEDILRNPIDHIESSLFDSWEQYFTFLVSDILKGYTGKAYSKSKLSMFLLNDTNLQKFRDTVPVEIQKLLDKH